MAEKQYNDLKAEAKRLCISERSLHRYCKDGQFPFIRLGGRILFDPDMSDAHMAARAYNGRAAEMAHVGRQAA